MVVNEINSILSEIQSHFGTIIYTVLAPIMDKYLTSDSKGDILNEYMIAAHDYVNRNRKWKSYDW